MTLGMKPEDNGTTREDEVMKWCARGELNPHVLADTGT